MPKSVALHEAIEFLDEDLRPNLREAMTIPVEHMRAELTLLLIIQLHRNLQALEKET